MKYTLSKGLNNSPDARAIRQSVFVEEQGFEYEFDDIDEIALHLVLYDENEILVQLDDFFSTVA